MSMSDLREYKCPACGGAIEFDSKSQKMKSVHTVIQNLNLRH